MKNNTETSKFLSYILRHEPDSIGLVLNSDGWADINELIQLANTSGNNITLEQIHSIVESDKKGRFSISKDDQYIRAVQGHSLKTVDLNLKETTPPANLLHGTAQRFIESINNEGLISQKRQYVHLTEDYDTAIKTGMRYGKPVVLSIDSRKMQKEGYKFYQAENDVWLTSTVPPAYIAIHK
ncbi:MULTISPECIES: RNA 2'-phosphotransferase [unclassified Psychrobacter]|uniref:RNA 2'-phosphotransferase n=1 Tax=unclassified Psychrobacter TaxID=196806 RepID=UPI0025B5D90C|nr:MULTISPECIES: RNA 2'-phosphotransferase [unclassified Psychrobacter]MDN3454613.1 RNA 2'-phosphotransferase [Psychrobacter sp. APC 3350]MDN3503603.1 RNA 2'-phosphotransferase [Psychrobacter sp. 5A.1]